MEYVGVDLHKSETQLCFLGDQGEVREIRIRTERRRFLDTFGKLPRARVLLEASTESEWVARFLEELGHEVIVADPNFAAMYATRSRKVKTDKRDARTLAEACRLGAYRPAHRAADDRRSLRARLAVRECLIRSRTRFINLVRGVVRAQGLRIRAGATESFVERVRELTLPGELLSIVGPLLAAMQKLNEQISYCDRIVEQRGKRDEVVQRLSTAPGVGTLVATAFVATLDDPKRFRGPHQVESFLGLVPSEMSSGEKQHRGGITKAGNGRMRYLLVQAAWSVLRCKSDEAGKLKDWVAQLAARRGKNVAMVALARRLAGILFAMWRDGTEYQVDKLQGGPPRLPAAA